MPLAPPQCPGSDHCGAQVSWSPSLERGTWFWKCVLLPFIKLCLMESTFSSPAEAALQREAGAGGQITPLKELGRVYELERIVGFIRNLGCQRVRAG